MNALAATLVIGYLLVALVLGVLAGRRGGGGVSDFVAGERAFGPVVMYFVVGATIFSAYALLGTPQRIALRGSDAFYILAYGAVGLVPLFFVAARVRRIGAVQGFVTQAELTGQRFDSRLITAMMGVASLLAFLPYLVIQLKGAGIVMEAVFGWNRTLGAALVYAVVTTYVLVGGVRGVGWTNVVQGMVMLVVVWTLGLWIPTQLYGGVGAMFDQVVERAPEYLTLPGPDDAPTTPTQYSAEILVSILGFAMWPHAFMKAFTARSARLAQLSVVLYPSFLFFILPLVFLGYVAVLEGGPRDDTVLFWLVQQPKLAAVGPLAFAFVAFAVLAASMSTGDALLHAGASIAVRDVLRGGFGLDLGERTQTRAMRGIVVGLAALSVLALWSMDARGLPVVDLLLLAYAIPIQFLPPVMLGLTWRRANALGAAWGLGLGLSTVALLFVARHAAPSLYAALNPLDLQIGVIGVAVNAAAMVILAWLGRPMPDAHLRRFEL